MTAEPEKRGNGCFVFANGELYHGDFLTSSKGIQRHGVGTFTKFYPVVDIEQEIDESQSKTSPKKFVYIGDWNDDLMTGKAEIEFPQGSRYSGELFKNKLVKFIRYIFLNKPSLSQF